MGDVGLRCSRTPVVGAAESRGRFASSSSRLRPLQSLAAQSGVVVACEVVESLPTSAWDRQGLHLAARMWSLRSQGLVQTHGRHGLPCTCCSLARAKKLVTHTMETCYVAAKLSYPVMAGKSILENFGHRTAADTMAAGEHTTTSGLLQKPMLAIRSVQ